MTGPCLPNFYEKMLLSFSWKCVILWCITTKCHFNMPFLLLLRHFRGYINYTLSSLSIDWQNLCVTFKCPFSALLRNKEKHVGILLVNEYLCWIKLFVSNLVKCMSVDMYCMGLMYLQRIPKCMKTLYVT